MATLVIEIDGAQAQRVMRDLETSLERYGAKARVVEGDTRKLEGGVSSLTAQGAKMVAQFAAAYLSIQSLANIIAFSARNAMEAEDSILRLNRAISNKGMAARVTTAELSAMASELQTVTRVGDDAIMRVQEVLLRFDSIDGTNIERLTRLTLDFAAATGQDAVSAARGLGRALEEPGEGMRALAQAGIVLNKVERETIEKLKETGQAARAQADLIDTLERKVGGFAVTAGSSAAGSIDKLKNAVGDLSEVLGGGFLEGLQQGSDVLTQIAQSDDAVATVKSIGESLGVVAGSLASILKLLNDIGATKALEVLVRAGAMTPGRMMLEGVQNGLANARSMDPLRGSGRDYGGVESAISQGAAARAADDARRSAEVTAGVAARAAERVAAFRKSLEHIVNNHAEWSAEMDRNAAELDNLVAAFDPLGTRVRDLERAQKLLNTAMAAGGANAAMYREALRSVNTELAIARAVSGASPFEGGTADVIDLTKTRPAAQVWRDISARADETAESAGVFVGFMDASVEGAVLLSGHLDRVNQYLRDHETRQEAVKRILEENRKQEQLLLDLIKQFPEYTEKWQKALDKVRQDTADVKFGEWVDALGAVADLLGQSNDQLGRMARAVLGIAQGWQQVQKARAAGDGVGQAAGYGQMAQSIYGAGTEAGWWGPKGGTSQFGAKKEGNYAKEGEAVGAVIGGIIGSFFGPAGTMAGAAIGQALGGIIGSFIKKGADEGLAQLRYEAGQIGVMIQKDEGGLGGVLRGIGGDIRDAILSITAALGGELQSMPDIFLKVRDDVVTVVVNGIKRRFKDVDDAISFAVAEALRGSEITGMSRAVSEALQNGRFESVEELSSAVNFITTLENAASGMSELSIALEKIVVQTAAAEKQLISFGVSADEAARIAWGALVGQLEGSRRQITGQPQTRAEQMAQKRAEAEIWNAQRQLAIAKIDLEMMEIQGRIEAIGTRERLVGLELGVFETELKGMAAYVSNRAALSEAEREVLQRQLVSLATIREKLAGMKDIDPGEIRLPGGGRAPDITRGIGGGGGGGWHQRLLDAVEKIRDYQKRLVLGELSPFTGSQKVDIAQAEVERLQAMYARGGRSRVLAMEGMPEAIDSYLGLFRSTYGATGEYERVFNQMNNYLSSILRDNGVAPVSAIREQAAENATAMSRTFYKDRRGKLHTRNEEMEEKLDRTNQFSEQTASETRRMREVLEDMAVAQTQAAANSNMSAPPQPVVRRTG